MWSLSRGAWIDGHTAPLEHQETAPRARSDSVRASSAPPLVAGVLVRICLLLVGGGAYPVSLSAQGYSQMEIGAQGASLTLIDPISSAEEKGGFGARVTYNVSPILAWDAEG